MFRVPQTIYRFLLIAALTVATPASGQDRWAVVGATKLNLREKPALQGQPLAILPRGTRVKVISRTPGWLKVSVDGKVGYLCDRDHYVRVVASESAEDGQAADRIASMRREAERIEGQIAKRRAEVVEITQQERATIADLDAIDENLSRIRATLAGLRAQLKSLQSNIEKSGQAIAAVKSETRQVKAQAAPRLAALYKLHWLGRVQVLAGAQTVNDFLIRERALGKILAADEATLERFYHQRRQLEDLMAAQAEQHRRRAALKAEVDAQLETAAAERERRHRILAAIRDRKALELAAIEALQKAAVQLDETIGELDRAEASPQAVAAAPDTPFLTRKGLLKMPVSGKVIHLFGPYRNPRFNVINVRGGIDIRAEKGEPIRAVHGGRVLYADWFKGYGNMMIIDHGDAYYTVYAHAEEILKSKGAPVEAGEVIATVGDTGSLDGAMLHFEVRHHGKPEDPLGWLKVS